MWLKAKQQEPVDYTAIVERSAEGVLKVPANNKPLFVSFMGADVTFSDDDGAMMSYKPRGEVVVNVNRIGAFYDHTIIVEAHKIRVMDTVSQIGLKILEAENE